MSPLLQLKDVSLSIGDNSILRDVSFSVHAGEILGVIGRSGSGKSMTALATMGLAPHSAEITGEVLFNNENLLQKTEREMCAIRGQKIAMIFQEPMTALNPLQTIGAQVVETLRIHSDVIRSEAAAKAETTLIRAGLPPNEAPPDRYPHELSGGQRQRAVIAIAIAMKPDLIIADEPTTALDVTTQAEIVDLLKTTSKEDGAGLIFITHNIAVVSSIADRIVVMNEGAVIKDEPSAKFITKNLLQTARPGAKEPANDEASTPLLKVDGITCDYPLQRKRLFETREHFRAVDNVSFDLCAGENIGLVGESGCGKSTLARALLGLERISSGSITLNGDRFPSADAKTMRRIRRKIQIVFQDPYGSFNPRQRVEQILAEPFHLYSEKPRSAVRSERIDGALESVGLHPVDKNKYPHQFSGGQRQRIAIARALITNPSIIVLDEATSALDIESRERVLTLLAGLSASHDLSYLFITHDLSVVRNITSRLMVMKGGAVVEAGATEDLFANPQHDYTKSLIAAAPGMIAAAQ